MHLVQVLFRFAHSEWRHLNAIESPRSSSSRSHEVNCGPQQFAWRLQLYDDPVADPSDIRAGNPVMLYHQEMDGLFTARVHTAETMRREVARSPSASSSFNASCFQGKGTAEGPEFFFGRGLGRGRISGTRHFSLQHMFLKMSDAPDPGILPISTYIWRVCPTGAGPPPSPPVRDSNVYCFTWCSDCATRAEG